MYRPSVRNSATSIFGEKKRINLSKIGKSVPESEKALPDSKKKKFFQ
jgi:hypothetical protein